MLTDRPARWEIIQSETLATGRVSNFRQDTVLTPSGERMQRQYVTHPGAVAIICWNDRDEIATVRQYRHPVGMEMIEPPAGLLDVTNESALAAAERELAEEVQLGATDWRVLTDLYTTAGGNQEVLRVFLARGVYHVERPDGFIVEGEEVHMQFAWLPRTELMAAVRDGRCGNPSLVVGMWALDSTIANDALDELRPGDAPWPARERHLQLP